MSLWHAWFSSQSNAACRETCRRDGIECLTPVYLDEDGKVVDVTFVTKNRTLEYDCKWEDLHYIGKVTKVTKVNY